MHYKFQRCILYLNQKIKNKLYAYFHHKRLGDIKSLSLHKLSTICLNQAYCAVRLIRFIRQEYACSIITYA